MRPAVALALTVSLVFGGLVFSGWGGNSPAVVAQVDDRAEFEGLPPGEGREDVFYTCQACHSLKTVQQQRLSREAWDETLMWMIDEQGMEQPELDEYDRLLEYLGTYLAPDSPK